MMNDFIPGEKDEKGADQSRKVLHFVETPGKILRFPFGKPDSGENQEASQGVRKPVDHIGQEGGTPG
jgi:hypothetical protein